MRTRGREGVYNPENFAYVLNGSPLVATAPREKPHKRIRMLILPKRRDLSPQSALSFAPSEGRTPGLMILMKLQAFQNVCRYG